MHKTPWDFGLRILPVHRPVSSTTGGSQASEVQLFSYQIIRLGTQVPSVE